MKLFLLLLVVVFLVFIGFGFFYQKESTFENQLTFQQSETPDLKPQVFSVINGPSPSLLLNKIREPEKDLEKEELRVENKKIKYFEIRNGRERAFTDVEKEIALKLLNLNNGKVGLIKIVKKGGELININSGFVIEAVERLNGIRWNNFNTILKVVSPSDFVVLKVKYPLITDFKAGEPVVEEVIYAPYNPELHLKEIITEGKKYLDKVDSEARNELNIRKVKSMALPNKFITEIISSEWIKRIPFLEQTDFGEFLLEPQKSFERVLWLLGTNKDRAFKHTQSYASALGWVQFTPRTYDSIAEIYKEAGLVKDFDSGARIHKNSLMAAYLLYDNNLKDLINKFGKDILEDPLLEEYLASSYNGRPSRTFASIDYFVSENRTPSDWTSELKDETKEFLEKLRYLKRKFEI